jgi:putative exporter of polyketide antibiotics
MFEYIKYILNVVKKPLIIWVLAPGAYMMMLPIFFSDGEMQKMVEQKRVTLEPTMGQNELMQKTFGIKDWEAVWTLEGVITTYLFNLFFPMLIAIASLVLINKITAKAEEDGTFEFVAALPMTRMNIAFIHSGMVVVMGILLGQIWPHLIYLSQLFFTDPMIETLKYSSLITAAFQSSLGAVSFAALGYAAGAVSGRSSRLWLFGLCFLAFEWTTSVFTSKVSFFDWYHNTISSFGAYVDPYNDGLSFGDVSLVSIKIILFLAIGIIGFKDRSLNLR